MLRFGADDFLTKRFDRSELIASILAIVRRSQGHCESAIRTGQLVVNLDTRVVTVDDGPVRLTPKEYGILELLNLRKGAILAKGMFLNHLYGGMDEPQPKIIDILICTLRKKLAQASGGRHYIETVRDGGNVLREIETRPNGARQVDQIEQQTSVRDRPTGRMRVSAIGSGARPPTAVLSVEVQFDDADTSDGGLLRVSRPDPVGSLFGPPTRRRE